MKNTTMNRLAMNRGYLCGAMDRVLDGGVGWRQDIMESLSRLEDPLARSLPQAYRHRRGRLGEPCPPAEVPSGPATSSSFATR